MRADGHLPSPRHAPGDSADLMRLARFRAANPDWRIGYLPELRYWEAWLPAADGGELVTRYLLGELLDRIDPPDSG